VFFFISNSGAMEDCLMTVGFFGTFAYDFQIRNRFSGLNLSEFIMIESAFIKRNSVSPYKNLLLGIISQLTMCNRHFSPDWLQIKNVITENPSVSKPWELNWGITRHERLRLRCILDAIIAELYGLDYNDSAWILRHDPSDPKGFWRVDQDQPIELRLTTLALAALKDLKEIGLDAFCKLNNGEGWMIPEALSFKVKDNGVVEFVLNGVEPLPVRDRLGPRFLPWQTEGTVEDSWEECRIHARNICGPTMKRDLGDNKQVSDPDQSGESGSIKTGKKKKPENMTLIMEV